ncbi:hypothetical protein pkur_cds_674 [Pandoravirus kuranda]|uniref:F-box domain containing protein n=1 Tax=Pandoravirus kuranda TaxID=3019033 RepID=A0AA95J4L7_9VIRU|nr:hypothetical protein pkur_cds_674 [Pandoravirus kuranda]
MKTKTRCTTTLGERKNTKRARIAQAAHEPCVLASPNPAISVLPPEMLAEIVRRLSLADLAATAASGAPLASAAQAALARNLKRSLDVAGVGDANGDPMGAVAVMYNAIGHDDASTLKAILTAGLVREIDEPLPSMTAMELWKTPIVAVFHIRDDDIIECPKSVRWKRADYQARRLYDTAHDVGAMPFRNTCRTLPQTPLVRAIRCGSRRCVRTLLAAGARPHPSPEALLGVALERILLTRVAIAERHLSPRWPHGRVWLPLPDRRTDRLGIIEDLTATFTRTPPPLHLLDTNPLSMLRYGANVCVGKDDEYDDLPRAIGAILGAGYSPDEPVSRLPLPDVPADGLLWSHTVSPYGAYGARHRPAKPRTETDPTRAALVITTERQAAGIRFLDALGEGVGRSERLIAHTMLHMYQRAAPEPCSHLVD